MKLQPNLDKIPEPIRIEPSFLACRYVLPVGVVAIAIAIVCVFLFYHAEDRSYNLTSPAIFGSWFLLLYRFALPAVRTLGHVDWIAFAMLIPVVAHFVVLCYVRGDTDSCAGVISLSLISAILFRSNLLYSIFSGCSLMAWFLTAELIAGLDLNPSVVMYLFVMAPIMCLVLRVSWMTSLTSIVRSRQEQREIAQELSSTVERLEKEERLRKQSEDQLVHAQKMESLGLLAGGIAHDFNNFLLGISALAETLELESNEASTRESAGGIREISQTASNVCRQMLTYSGRSYEPHAPVKIDSLLETMRPLLRAAIPRDVEMVIEIPNSSSFGVLADSAQIQQAILNLVTNSGQAISNRVDELQSGMIEITVARHAGENLETDPSMPVFGNRIETSPYVGISVTDNGVGISAEELPRIFDPYFTKKDTGHGLGLSVTLGIAMTHGGAIRCRSQLGVGTTVEILLPFVGAEDETTHQDHAANSELNCGHILLVDDEPIILDSISRLLESTGCKVTRAENGLEALDILSVNDRFDAILLDYSMPGFNGLETLKEMRQRNILVPVILCSGFMMPEPNSSEKPEAFIQKPYQLAELRNKLSLVSEVFSSSSH